MSKKIEIANKKALFNFSIEQKYTCGIVLTGSEVKSIRMHNVNMGDAYIRVDNSELWLYHLHISLWKNTAFDAHVEPMRPRKLLVKKQELARIALKAKTKSYALFPIRLFETETGLFKVEMGLGQGKKLFDKREDLKEKDQKKQIKTFLS